MESVGGGLQIIDITDPSQPVLLGSNGSAQFPTSVHVEGNTAYIAAEEGLYVLDVGDAAHPKLLARNTSQVVLYDLQIVGNRAYVTHEGISPYGLAIYDVSNPAKPTPLGTYPSGRPRGVVVAGSTAYVGDNGLKIIDVSDATNPQGICSFHPDYSTESEGIDVQDGIAYVAQSFYDVGGVELFDVSTPTNPKSLGWYETSLPAKDVDADNGLIYLVTGEGGLRILRYTPVYPPRALLPLVLR